MTNNTNCKDETRVLGYPSKRDIKVKDEYINKCKTQEWKRGSTYEDNFNPKNTYYLYIDEENKVRVSFQDGVIKITHLTLGVNG